MSVPPNDYARQMAELERKVAEEREAEALREAERLRQEKIIFDAQEHARREAELRAQQEQKARADAEQAEKLRQIELQKRYGRG
jgi:hypothetical protein